MTFEGRPITDGQGSINQPVNLGSTHGWAIYGSHYCFGYQFMLNRAVLMVRPRQPFLDWAAQLDDSGLVPNVEGEQTVYLVPQFDDDDEAQKVLSRVFAEVFERELFGWHTDEAAWPRKRTLALFRKWFTIELHSVVEDLCDCELVDNEG